MESCESDALIVARALSVSVSVSVQSANKDCSTFLLVHAWIRWEHISDENAAWSLLHVVHRNLNYMR